MEKIKDAYYWMVNLFYFIVALPAWLKLAWNSNYDYDAHVIVNMIKWKLERIKKHIAEHQRHLDWESDVAKINETISLFDDAIDNFEQLSDTAEIQKAFEDKYGDVDMKFDEETRDTHTGSVGVKFVCSKATTPEENEAGLEEWRRITNLEYTIRYARWLKAFDMLRDNIPYWWC